MARKAKPASLIEQLTDTPHKKKLYLRVRLDLHFTELLCQELQDRKVGRRSLAGRLGWSLSKLNNFLDGDYVMTIHDLSDILTALDRQLDPNSLKTVKLKI